MTWWKEFVLPFLPLLSALLFLCLAFGLDMGREMYRLWVRVYTVFMPQIERKARSLDMEGDIADYIADHKEEGYKPGEIGAPQVCQEAYVSARPQPSSS